MNPKITGLPHDAAVDGVRIKDLGVNGTQQVIRANAPNNYRPFDGWVCVGRGEDPWMLKVLHSVDGADQEDEVIDCQSMYGVANIGHGVENAIEPFVRYLLREYAAHSRVIDSRLHAAALLALRKYIGIENVSILFKNGGAEAIDTLVKVARRFLFDAEARKRREITNPVVICAENAFHGRTLCATSLLSGESQRGFGPFIRVVKVPFGDIGALENALKQNSGCVACVLLEPIQGEGGIIIPPQDYLPRAQELCREYETLFALDEIQTGFGRTGKDFAYQHYQGVTPDLVVVAKALGAGLVPASALIGRKDILGCLNPGDEGSTWSASPLVCMGILIAIKETCDQKLANNARDRGEYLLSRLGLLRDKFPRVVKEVRGKGLMIAVEFSQSAEWVRAFSHRLLENGVMAFPTHGTIVRVLPPLCVTTGVAGEIAYAFETTLAAM